jgi:hypothetical protein
MVPSMDFSWISISIYLENIPGSSIRRIISNKEFPILKRLA